jgi:Family of unknown function (DUF6326)
MDWRTSPYRPKEREIDHAIGRARSGLRTDVHAGVPDKCGPTDPQRNQEPMMTTARPATTLDAQPVSVRAKLAAAWTSFMFLYAYVDILGFYTPGTIQDILDGKVFAFDLSQAFSATALTLVAVPIFMVVLSVTLPASVNRITNLVMVGLYIPVTVFNVAGGSYLYFYGLGVVLELVLLAVIVRYAWTWPRTARSATSPHREAVRAHGQG